MKLAVKVYPRSKRVDDAFQRLLMDNILPLASRRRPDAVDMFLENEDVNRLLDYYRDALEQIFAFYATSDKRTHAAMAAYAGTRGGSSLGYSGKSPMRATKAVNTMKGALGYGEFLKFASDFDLANSVILSTIELGDIYLSSIKAVEPDSTIRKLTFVEFWEALVRCSLVAYSKISDTSVLDKVRGLLLYMWRSINKNVPKAFTDRRNVSTYAGAFGAALASFHFSSPDPPRPSLTPLPSPRPSPAGDLLSGAMLFNKRFTAAWAQDGYRDYLSPDPRVVESGKTVLSRIRGNLGGGSQGAGYASTLGAGGAAQAAAADAYYGAGSSASASDGSYGYGGGAAPAEGAGYGAGGYGGGNGEGGGNGGAGSGGVFYGYGGAAGNGGGPGGAGSYGY
jgi:hypothetical protein